MGNLADLIAKYGFPIVAAGGMGYMIYYVWTWATREIKPVLNDANTVLIALIDRIRMLDNDLIEKILTIKEERKYTLYDLSKKLGFQVTTIERWLRTGHINQVYAQLVKERLGIE